MHINQYLDRKMTITEGEITTDPRYPPKHASTHEYNGADPLRTSGVFQVSDVYAHNFKSWSPKKVRRDVLKELMKINIEDKKTLPPEVVDERGSMDMGELISFMIKALQDQESKINELERMVKNDK